MQKVNVFRVPFVPSVAFLLKFQKRSLTAGRGRPRRNKTRGKGRRGGKQARSKRRGKHRAGVMTACALGTSFVRRASFQSRSLDLLIMKLPGVLRRTNILHRYQPQSHRSRFLRKNSARSIISRGTRRSAQLCRCRTSGEGSPGRLFLSKHTTGLSVSYHILARRAKLLLSCCLLTYRKEGASGYGLGLRRTTLMDSMWENVSKIPGRYLYPLSIRLRQREAAQNQRWRCGTQRNTNEKGRDEQQSCAGAGPPGQYPRGDFSSPSTPRACLHRTTASRVAPSCCRLIAFLRIERQELRVTGWVCDVQLSRTQCGKMFLQ